MMQMLNGMWQSLKRAGDNLDEQFARKEVQDGDLFAIRLKLEMPEKAKKYVAGFMREYARQSGWKIRDVSFHAGRVEFSCYPAPPEEPNRAPGGTSR